MRRSGHATGMAGEYFVMERLFRLGHEPALTLGHAKTIDIIVRTRAGRLLTISVKSVRGGGKWPVDARDVAEERDLFYVFLHYRDFENLTTDPEVFIMPARDVQELKRPWFNKYAIYFSSRKHRPSDIERYKNVWSCIA